jgi:hypothetical protein
MLTKAFVFSMILAPMFLPACRSKLPRAIGWMRSSFPRLSCGPGSAPRTCNLSIPNRFGVAFLAQTLTLKGDDVVLDAASSTAEGFSFYPLIAVTRIESQKITGQRPASRRRSASDS